MISQSLDFPEPQPVVYDCEKCQDKTYIIVDNRTSYPCECEEAQEIKRKWKTSGMKEVFEEKSLDNFRLEGRPRILREAKTLAMNYTFGFSRTEKRSNHSIAFLGTVGSGKTHLAMGIAGALLDKNVGVHYFSYREAITDLKQNIMNSIQYKKAIGKYMNVTVLLFDDLFKGKITESDINIVFEIINHRYLHRKPIIVSSEYNMEQLLDLDEAIGSRILEMCKGRIIEFEDQNLNYRLHQ